MSSRPPAVEPGAVRCPISAVAVSGQFTDGQLVGELVGGGVADRAEHSEPAGPADGRGDGGERRE
ncbi:hypothetical protein AB0N07_45005, partial [Streptomyces sp. NPDC051172]|uniref:hypothetical protein n=1 Tax=Streptomyces sp. NPDC051172 TaxID=3155796 RepID=UPI00342D837A